jgi:hypothetical protein
VRRICCARLLEGVSSPAPIVSSPRSECGPSAAGPKDLRQEVKLAVLAPDVSPLHDTSHQLCTAHPHASGPISTSDDIRRLHSCFTRRAHGRPHGDPAARSPRLTVLGYDCSALACPSLKLACAMTRTQLIFPTSRELLSGLDVASPASKPPPRSVRGESYQCTVSSWYKAVHIQLLSRECPRLSPLFLSCHRSLCEPVHSLGRWSIFTFVSQHSTYQVHHELYRL